MDTSPMDTSDYPSLPNLNQMHARLAADSRRVEAVIDSQLDEIERLFSATIAQDWTAVAEAARYLAALPPESIGPPAESLEAAEKIGADVIREARHVYNELSHSPQPTQPPQHLALLLSACRLARQARV